MTDERPQRGPVGRPSPIDAVLDYDQTGNPITVADRVIALVRIGMEITAAAAAAGIHRDTIYEWQNKGAKAHIAAKGRDLEDLDLTDHERRCVSFSDALMRAIGDYESRANATLQQLGTGAYTWTDTRTEYNAKNEVVKRIVEEKHLPPNAQVVEWRLSRRFPSRYGDRIEVATDVPVSEEEHTSELVTSLRAFQESRQAEKSARKSSKRAANGETG